MGLLKRYAIFTLRGCVSTPPTLGFKIRNAKLLDKIRGWAAARALEEVAALHLDAWLTRGNGQTFLLRKVRENTYD
jgi:hypothetical protein